MSSSNTLSDERLVEILAFEDTDISDCPELTDEQLARMKPRHPEYFIREKEAVQVNLDTAILADYETRINELLWQAMRNSRLSRV